MSGITGSSINAATRFPILLPDYFLPSIASTMPTRLVCIYTLVTTFVRDVVISARYTIRVLR